LSRKRVIGCTASTNHAGKEKVSYKENYLYLIKIGLPGARVHHNVLTRTWGVESGGKIEVLHKKERLHLLNGLQYYELVAIGTSLEIPNTGVGGGGGKRGAGGLGGQRWA